MTGDRPLTGVRVLVPRGGTWGDDVAASLSRRPVLQAPAPLTLSISSTGGPQTGVYWEDLGYFGISGKVPPGQAGLALRAHVLCT